MNATNKPEDHGFTLIELMIVVAILSIIAAASVPSLVSSKVAANESNAIGTLRNLTSAQAQFWSNAVLDDDLDGAGEFGYFAELAGAVPLNGRANGNGTPNPLDPPILSARFGDVDAAGRVSLSGYVFQIFLPDAAGAGLAEAGGGGPTGAEDADQCEIYWCAYAYPMVAGTSGHHAFFVNHRGEILKTSMDVARYDLSQGPPAWNAALSNVSGDMSDPPAIGGLVANDGNTWVVVH